MVLPASDDVDATAALDKLFADCAADKACAQAHPALAQRLAGRCWRRCRRAATFADPVTGQARPASR